MRVLRFAGMTALLAVFGQAALAQGLTPPADIPAAPAPPTIRASPVSPITRTSPEAASEAPRIEWEVKNRFRLFRSERDFQRHVAAYRADGVLAAERRLERDTGGRGWARTMVGSLCVDGAGNLNETCTRDRSEEHTSELQSRFGIS